MLGTLDHDVWFQAVLGRPRLLWKVISAFLVSMVVLTLNFQEVTAPSQVADHKGTKLLPSYQG